MLFKWGIMHKPLPSWGDRAVFCPAICDCPRSSAWQCPDYDGREEKSFLGNRLNGTSTFYCLAHYYRSPRGGGGQRTTTVAFQIITEHTDEQKCIPVGKSITRTMTPPQCKTNAKFTTIFLVPSLQSMWRMLSSLCCSSSGLLLVLEDQAENPQPSTAFKSRYYSGHGPHGMDNNETALSGAHFMQFSSEIYSLCRGTRRMQLPHRERAMDGQIVLFWFSYSGLVGFCPSPSRPWTLED